MLSIFNSALAKLGSNRLEQIESVNEDSAPAALCRLFFPQVLELALDYAPWSFALRKAKLARESVAPEEVNGSYPYQFSLPDDCIRPVRLGLQEPGSPFIIEAGRLLAPVADAWLLYVARVDEPAGWTPAFTQAVILGLASELCPALLNDINRQQYYQETFREALAHAAAADLKRQKFNPREGQWLLSRN